VQKIEIYKKLVSIDSVEELDDLNDELIDRFGDLPPSVVNLFAIARIKLLGTQLGIQRIYAQGDDLFIQFHPDEQGNVDGKVIDHLALSFDNRFARVSTPKMKNTSQIQLRGKNMTMEQKVHILEDFIVQYRSTIVTKGDKIQNVAN
jgi:transcription-repair coupling factor (superfamily II helicase)